MGAISVFDFASGEATKLIHKSFALERHLQSKIENNLDVMLGIRFLKSEFPTSNGRIDTIGLDENNTPVVIEYKRNRNDGIILQSLFYLDWLQNHRLDFRFLVDGILGSDVANQIDWAKPRIICIAESFSPYDVSAVNQIKRDVQLLQYHWFRDDLLVLESLNTDVGIFKGASSVEISTAQDTNLGEFEKATTTNLDDLKNSESYIQDMFKDLDDRLFQLGTDVNRKPVKTYVAYRKVKNFAAVQIQKRSIAVYLKIDPKSVDLEDQFSSDMTNIGHIATGNLELVLKTVLDVERAMPLITRSYEENL
ncbi:DUF5655 domain-containing protein [Deinococcus sp.]|uniref:DUF5655 domain-containing protein n=1 Tax=Deinococcus sp. TaxID=47478 RepID=UPI003C7D0FFF